MDWLLRIFSRPEQVAPTDIAVVAAATTAAATAAASTSSGSGGGGGGGGGNIKAVPTSVLSTGASTDDDGDEDDGDDDSEIFEYQQPDFDEKYWRYMKIAPDVYGIQRFRSEPGKQNAEPIHYLVTTDNSIYKWCIALERERLRTRRRESQRPAVNAIERRPQHVPGVVGAFVAMGSGRRPVFAFEEGERCLYLLDDVNTADYSVHETLLLRCRVPLPSANVHLARFTRTGLTTGETTVDRLARSAAQATAAAAAAAAALPTLSPTAAAPPARMSAVVDAMHTIDLEIETKSEVVAPEPVPPAAAAAAASSIEHDPVVVVNGKFTGYSPVDPRDVDANNRMGIGSSNNSKKKRRWVVIGRDYWELYHAFEEMHYRSGCYLMKLAANGAVIEASERRELDHARGEHTLSRNLELLVRRMSDPEANESERLRILQQAVEIVERLDVLHRAQALINDK